MQPILFIRDAVGWLTVQAIHFWLCLCGRRVPRPAGGWLDSTTGPDGAIGEQILEILEREHGLIACPDPAAGLHSCFEHLRGPGFEPTDVRPEVRDFYEHTARYRLEASGRSNPLCWCFLFLLVRFVSRRMNQLNFPISARELAGGMTSEVVPLHDRTTGRHVATLWRRRLAATGKVIYAGLYGMGTPPGFERPCVKVCFPVPRGCATVFLKPEVGPGGSLCLVSAGSGYGQPGFYRIFRSGTRHWHVRYLQSLHERFHVYVDDAGLLRTEHTIRFLGLPVLSLQYTIRPREADRRLAA